MRLFWRFSDHGIGRIPSSSLAICSRIRLSAELVTRPWMSPGTYLLRTPETPYRITQTVRFRPS